MTQGAKLPWRVKLSIVIGVALGLGLLALLFVIAIPIAIALLVVALVAATAGSLRRRYWRLRQRDAAGRRNVRVVER